MGAGMKVLTGIRVIALMATLVVVGLSVWSLVVVHDIKSRGAGVLQRLRPEASTAQEWRDFFIAATNANLRIWITIVAASVASLASLLVVLSTTVKRLWAPVCMQVPVEFVSMCGMVISFGCTLSVAFSLIAFTRKRLETADSANLTMFTMILPLSRGLVITSGFGNFVLLITTVTAIIQVCTQLRDKESCSFEPTAAALGMGYEYQAIVPPSLGDRPPSLYDPRKPLPKQLDGMPQTEEESALADPIAPRTRVDSSMSERSKYSGDVEKEETWPLNQEKPQVPAIRSSRPWSETPNKLKSPGVHAI
ncbi:hypothetical protein ACEQ8H_001212 [Pleosporales sp. CAS-2024a]